MSDILQHDGNDSLLSESDSISEDNDTDYDTDDEIDPTPTPVILTPVPNQLPVQGQPIQLEVVSDVLKQPSPLPLCMMLNCRSLYNKVDNFKNLLHQIGPDISLVSETWERQKQSLENLLSSEQFKVISYKRAQTGNRQPGGGCAIIYNDDRYRVTKLDLPVPIGVEAAWALFTPVGNIVHHKVRKIAVGTFYVSPRSAYKDASIDHIIESIHLLRSKYDNEIHFFLGGDLNRLDIEPILDSYGALKQVISTGTRKDAILENIITDLHSFYHPPTTLSPLQVDEGKKGADSDHEVVIFAPLSNVNYQRSRDKKTIITRPLPNSGFISFGQDITQHTWGEVLNTDDVNTKVVNFHETLRSKLDKHFPTKSIKISTLDKKWFSPSLKLLHRKVKREFYKHRQSNKWRKLKARFKKLKRKAIKTFYSKFVNDLKQSEPGKWYKMAKRIGAVDEMNSGVIKVDELEGLDNKTSANMIAQAFASVSNEYTPVDLNSLPCYRPVEKPPQVEEYSVYEKVNKLKNTKSTFNIDLPNKVRKEFSVDLTTPLTDIVNSCLVDGVYPQLWKYEYITPVPKVTHPKVIKELRKIPSTSDYSKVFESFIKDWLVEDITPNLDIGQFGGRQGMGTEHMLVCLVNRILTLLDNKTEPTVVVAAMVDWTSAFDRQDPTLAIQKFLKMGVRPSLIPVLISYLTDRRMRVKFNGEISEEHQLVGGGPQGTLLGLLEYLVQSNDNADCVDSEDRFKYVDDLSILEVLYLTGILVEYDCHQHVPSDIGIDQLYLPPEKFNTQDSLNKISQWTDENLMQINVSKSNYMLFTRTQTDFATRLKVNNLNIDKLSEAKICGVWLTEDLKWDKNVKEITRKAFARMSMLTKLKYVGVPIEDLLDVYILFIRSLTEYCAVVWHSSLTVDLVNKLERVQRICLKVILADNYVSYEAALEMCNLDTLYQRREDRCLAFAKKCVKHPVNKRLFPVNHRKPNLHEKAKEKFSVNFARGEALRKSTIPYLQRRLNLEYSD